MCNAMQCNALRRASPCPSPSYLAIWKRFDRTGAWHDDVRSCDIIRHQVWTKMVKYDVRKNFADTRMRVKGRFVKKEDEALLREVMACA